MKPNHKDRDHALLSPSSSNMWLNCTPSALVNDALPDTENKYAEEGTIAHELCEHLLTKALGLHNKRIPKIVKDSEWYSPDMLDFCNSYVTYVLGITAKYDQPIISVEERFDVSAYVPECFGSVDCLILSDAELHVIDFKYGQGVPVSAYENTQLKIYALGAHEKYNFIYDINKITIHVMQPRIDNTSSFEMDIEDLLTWTEEELIPKAVSAFKGDGERVSGDHCKFCKASASCPVKAQGYLEVMDAFELEPPDALSLDQLSEIITKTKGFDNWIKKVKELSLDLAFSQGVKIPGYKVVEGRSNRIITDKEKLKEKLVANGYNDLEIEKRELLGLTALEKIVGKTELKELAKDLIIKPMGSPTLVPEDDKRPEWNGELLFDDESQVE